MHNQLVRILALLSYQFIYICLFDCPCHDNTVLSATANADISFYFSSFFKELMEISRKNFESSRNSSNQASRNSEMSFSVERTSAPCDLRVTPPITRIVQEDWQTWASLCKCSYQSQKCHGQTPHIGSVAQLPLILFLHIPGVKFGIPFYSAKIECYVML